ncbi:hypothetical protein D7D52_32305 [Nocardia yunnanensis]|uniref:Uncharacterized protein n=1 Tax=Nocardia yunnanensis TaxID=2382165 RepID=A0A386ZII8_9NOCA|nr:hypothetical protein [Nocardia yunnanensis]AYF77722.1 hypothetical protein D7D52_32305 [Nocardia yunnanensis]
MTILLHGNGIVDAHDRALHIVDLDRPTPSVLTIVLHDFDRAGLKLVVLDADNRQLFYDVSCLDTGYQIRGEFRLPAGVHTIRIRVSSPLRHTTQFRLTLADTGDEL